MAVYKTDDVLYLLKKAGYVNINNDGGSHQGYRNVKTGIEQPVAIHGKELNSHTTESIISYVMFTCYICGEDPEKYKNLSTSIVNYIKKCKKNCEKDFVNIVPTTLRRRLKFNNKDDVVRYIENLRKENNIIIENTEDFGMNF